MFRLETRSGFSSGFASTNSWTSVNGPVGGPTLTKNTWYSIKITINATGTAKYTYNNISPNVSATSSSCTIINGTLNTYIGIIGDGIDGGYIDNIKIII